MRLFENDKKEEKTIKTSIKIVDDILNVKTNALWGNNGLVEWNGSVNLSTIIQVRKIDTKVIHTQRSLMGIYFVNSVVRKTIFFSSEEERDNAYNQIKGIETEEKPKVET